MSDFQVVRGFEEVWRPPVRPRRRTPEGRAISSPGLTPVDVRARLARIVRRAPEVMVKVTGRTRDPGRLAAHLNYFSRHGALALEDADGTMLVGRKEVAELSADWAAAAFMDSRRRANTPMSVSVVLSMPASTDPIAVRDAARTFAARTFANQFDYVFALHTDTPRPHVHLAVAALGREGQHLNPKKADLQAWREGFAEALREQGIAAEATPRRARGVTRKAERGPIRRMSERASAGGGAMPVVRQAAYRDAASAAFQGDTAPRPWEAKTAARQAAIRGLYLAQAKVLQRSAAADDRELGWRVEQFVHDMPALDSQRLALARELRMANARESARTAAHSGRAKDRL